MPGLGLNWLIVNTGSSSVKWRVYSGKDILIDRNEWSVSSRESVNRIVKTCVEMKCNIQKIVHRVVHGGRFESPKKLDAKLVKQLKQKEELAPLHQARAIEIIELLEKSFPEAKQYVCFDSSFHLTMSEVSKVYAIPSDYRNRFGIERTGFHGIAHQALYNELCSLKGVRKIGKVVSCQLGNGVSLCAIKGGKSVDTTMGLTPLEGCVMGTRSGSIDPAIVSFLSKKLGKSASEIVEILESKSGLYGLCGERDMRNILLRVNGGDKKAKLALDVFVHSFKKHLGQMIVALGGVDAIVLGGGISNSDLMRKKLFEGLEELGIEIDTKKVGGNAPVKISSGKIEIWVLEGDEIREMKAVVD